jgi:hypothetical protein
MTAALALDVSAEMTPPPASLPRSTDGQLLAALPTAVGCAQRFVRYTLERWGLFVLIGTAETAAAELVGEAVSATGIAIEHPSYLDLYDKRLNLVDLRLHLIGTHVVIEVWDADPTPPRPQTSAPDPSLAPELLPASTRRQGRVGRAGDCHHRTARRHQTIGPTPASWIPTASAAHPGPAGQSDDRSGRA